MESTNKRNPGADEIGVAEAISVNSAVGEGDAENRVTVSPRVVSFVLIVSLVYLLLGAYVWGNRSLWDPGVQDNAAEVGPEPVQVGVLTPTSSSDGKTRVLVGGFSSPEADGTWISSMVARISFEAVGGRAEKVVLNFVPFVYGDVTSRTIQISSSKEDVEVSLREGINTVGVGLDGSSAQTIDFFCPRLDSPLSLGLSEDPRSLCAKLLDLTVLPD